MKKLTFTHSNPELTTVTSTDGQELPMTVALKTALGMAVSSAKASIEEFRKWFNIGNKLDASETDVELEDAEYELVKKLFYSGVDTAFPTIKVKALAAEVDRILNEAKDLD